MAVSWITATDLDDPTSPEAADAARYASWILYKLSGEKYAGIRSAVEWYGIPGGSCAICSSTSSTLIGASHNHIGSTSQDVANFSTRGLLLRGRPVLSVENVISSTGEVAPPSSYILVNNAYLINTDKSCWNLQSGVTIEYTFGNRPPTAGRIAAIRLANELLKLISDPESCSLPDRVTSVSRQGVSYTILDPQEFISEGRTGIYEIDLFLQAANPSRGRKKPRVFVPGSARGERYN